MRKMSTFGQKSFDMDQSVVDRLWHIASICGVACWGYFQSIHHLLHTLVFIFLCNMVLKTIMTIKSCIRRRKLNKEVDIVKCIQSLGFWDLLKEFAVTAIGLCFLTAMYKMLGHDGSEPKWLASVINWLAYFSFVVYTIMTFIRLGNVFPDTTIVAAVRWIISKINLKKSLPGEIAEKIDLDDGSIKELETIVKEKVNKEDNNA